MPQATQRPKAVVELGAPHKTEYGMTAPIFIDGKRGGVYTLPRPVIARSIHESGARIIKIGGRRQYGMITFNDERLSKDATVQAAVITSLQRGLQHAANTGGFIIHHRPIATAGEFSNFRRVGYTRDLTGLFSGLTRRMFKRFPRKRGQVTGLTENEGEFAEKLLAIAKKKN